MQRILRLAPLLALLLLGVACTEEAERIQLKKVPPPTGGSLETITVLDSPDRTRVVAASEDALHIRNPAVDPWKTRQALWPDQDSTSGPLPLAGALWSKDTFNFPSNQRLTTHRGRIWLLTRRRPEGAPVLLVSHDLGQSWSEIGLPNAYGGGHKGSRQRRSAGSKLSRINARTPLRLVDRGEHGLFLIDEYQIWQANFSKTKPVTFESWKSIDLSGIASLDTASPSALPTVARNYLPATSQRPYELLTVFGDQLYVYRRHRESDRWVLVSTLPTIDLSLHDHPSADLVYLMSPDAIYRSSEQGEQWSKLTVNQPLSASPKHRSCAMLVEPPDADASPNPMPTLLIGTDSGAIYRSADGGDTWRVARKSDPDNRAITGIAVEPRGGHVWASTEGSGVLISDDRGNSWKTSNKSLRSTRPLSISVGVNDELVLGTRAGLFRLTGAPEDGHWDRYHDRASSSVAIRSNDSNLFAGTLGGAIVTETPDGELTASKAGDFEQSAGPLFQPATTPSQVNDDSAILTVQARPNSTQMFAWSRHRGMLRSSDAGVSWQREPLNRALLSALRRSVVTNFLVDHGQRMYLTSHPFEIDAPAQLWHSMNDGTTWHAVYTFPETRSHHPLLLRRHERHATETLHLAHGGRVARSTNGGSSWTDLHGPWESGTISAYALGEENHTVVFNTHHSTRVAFAQNNDSDRPDSRDYTLVWPGKVDRPNPNVLDIVAVDRFVYLTTEKALYAGTKPQGEAQLPHAPTIIATLVFILLLIGLSFWYLRFE